MKESYEVSEICRAEDILLGALGYSDDAQLEKVIMSGSEINLHGHFLSDGEKFVVIYDCEIGPLENWAIAILRKAGKVFEHN